MRDEHLLSRVLAVAILIDPVLPFLAAVLASELWRAIETDQFQFLPNILPPLSFLLLRLGLCPVLAEPALEAVVIYATCAPLAASAGCQGGDQAGDDRYLRWN